MTYEQFFDGEAWLARAYRDAYRSKIDNQNTLMWVQGMYVYHAISDFTQFYNSFVQHPKALDYIEAPIPLTKHAKEEQAHEKTVAFAEQMKAQAEAYNRKLAEKEKQAQDGGGTDNPQS